MQNPIKKKKNVEGRAFFVYIEVEVKQIKLNNL